MQFGNFFEDFRIGDTLEHTPRRTVTEGDAAVYLSLTGDRHPLFCDAEFARRIGYKREVLNDLLVFHLVFGKSVPDVSLNAVANLGYARVLFPRPTYPGDTLRARSKVLGKKENSNGQTGNVYVRTSGFNQRGEIACEFVRWVMVRKKDPGTATGFKDEPLLPKDVPADKLTVDAELDLSRWSATAAAGPRYFEDYVPGERIHHGAGMTIDEAEHAMATRLYQNTARVHFDAHYVQRISGGRRLVYGGHVISVARALGFNGLENALRIAAWNSGTHANPTHAGDTLHAWSDVLACEPVTGRDDVGALRIALIAVKNQDPVEQPIELRVFDPQRGREVYHPNVVLDLNYWVLMPKRASAGNVSG